jgi:conjugal transfer mating pair stabilization protein TraG
MWEIYAYQNADSLFGIFNAAATIHGSGDYMAAVAAVAFCGFIAALVAYAFAPEKLQGWKWLATVLLVFSVLIVPRVTVGVVDKTGGSAVKVVANVPFGVAFLGSVTSTVGHTLTGLFETAFQVIPGVGALPSELSYEKNGLMFGNRLIRETGGVAFQDPNFRTDLVNFIHNCTMYDLIDGTVDPGTFSSSDDVWALMASPNPARFTTLTSAGGSITVDTCPNAYTNLNGRLPGAADPHPGQARLPAESDAAGGSRQRCHRRADPAGIEARPPWASTVPALAHALPLAHAPIGKRRSALQSQTTVMTPPSPRRCKAGPAPAHRTARR